MANNKGTANAALLADINRGILQAEEEERARRSLMNRNKKRMAVLTRHDRKVTQGKDGCWRTRVRLPDGKVRMIVRLTQEDLLDALVEHYNAVAEQVTLRSAFQAWIEWKRSRGKVTEQTLTRYQNHFDRYFRKDGGDDFADADLRAVTPADFDELIARLAKVPKPDDKKDRVKVSDPAGQDDPTAEPAEVSDTADKGNRSVKRQRTPGLTGRQYRDLKIILRGALTYAHDHLGLVTKADDLLDGIRVGEINFREPDEPEDPQVFTDEEERLLLKHFAEHPTIVHLGLTLLFKSGLRVGELSALRWEYVNIKDKTLSIRATEVQYKDADGHVVIAVQNFPKTASGRRDVVLPSGAEATLKAIRAINPFGEWFFAYDDKEKTRIRSQAFRRALRRACVAVGIPPRSTHKIRATYATELLDSDFSEAAVKDQLGHADVATTRRIYYRNRKTTEEIRAGLDAALGGR